MPTLRGTAQTAAASSVSSLVINIPAGVVANDQLRAYVVTTGTSGFFFSNPAPTVSATGWTLTSSQNNGSTALISCFRRTADGTEGSSITFNFSASAEATIGAVIAYSSVSTTRPLDGESLSVGSGFFSTPTAAGFNTTTNNDTLLAIFADPDSSTTFTTPTAYTQQWNLQSQGLALAGYSFTLPAKGATGNVYQNSLSFDRWFGSLTALTFGNAHFVVNLTATNATTGRMSAGRLLNANKLTLAATNTTAASLAKTVLSNLTAGVTTSASAAQVRNYSIPPVIQVSNVTSVISIQITQVSANYTTVAIVPPPPSGGNTVMNRIVATTTNSVPLTVATGQRTYLFIHNYSTSTVSMWVSFGDPATAGLQGELEVVPGGEYWWDSVVPQESVNIVTSGGTANGYVMAR